MSKRRPLLVLTLVVIILLPLAAPSAGRAQETDNRVAQLMAEMSTAEKVGQLFLVTFPGTEVADDALIAELIRDYRVGGVVLLPENGNIVNKGDTPEQVATLVGQLQEAAWVAAQQTTDVSSGPFIPLFVAVSHEGNGMPYTSIVNGTTPLPSQMALGATWNPSYAETTGQIAGQEMYAMGINVLLGPSLDVLENPLPESAGDLGVRSFGGEPFWVGQMGQAYIRGVHQGADGRVAVIAKHFPGLGASDRSLSEEVSTVQRTLEKLRQVDLAPFFAAAQSEDPLNRPDGVLVSHIRFRGLEGDRFATTRPISVDSQWLQRLLGQEELIAWREEGGVTVSDGLGVRALRRFYDPNEASFNSRRIAREAFLAGNDLLILSQFALTDDWEAQATNVRSTITFFQEQYESNTSFQAAVDEAVARILRLKLSLYDSPFNLTSARPNTARVESHVGVHQEMLTGIGRDGITLLSPPSPDLIPSPPTPDDNIVIFTDSRSGQPCPLCEPVAYIDSREIEETMVGLYGPAATGQVTPWRVSSFTFDDLEEFMSAPPSEETGEEQGTPPSPHPVEPALQNADWVILGMLDPANGSPQPSVVRRFLAEYADTLRSPNLVVLAYDAPYYLDATEVNKLSAYYVAYSHVAPFVATSIQAMFGEFAPTGEPPVNVTGINYDLATHTSPDPNQTITLNYSISKPTAAGTTPEPTQEITPTPEATGESLPPEPQPEIGDILKLQTSAILDHNDHPVPDGTPVQFIFTYPQEALESSVTVTTRGGVAETALTLDRAGQLDISIQTDPVPRTVVLQITVPGSEEDALTATPGATSTPTPTPTLTPVPEPTPAKSPQPTPGPGNGGGTPTGGGAGLGDLILALFGVLVASGAGYYALRFKNEPVERSLRIALWSTIGGLGLYVAYAIGLPGAGWLRQQSGVWAAGWVALFGSIVPLAIAWLAGRQRTTE